MGYTNKQLKERYPSRVMQQSLTIEHPDIKPGDPMLEAFTRAADVVGMQPKEANRFLRLWVEELKTLQKK